MFDSDNVLAGGNAGASVVNVATNNDKGADERGHGRYDEEKRRNWVEVTSVGNPDRGL